MGIILRILFLLITLGVVGGIGFGGYTLYEKFFHSDLQSQLDKANEKISALSIDNDRLKISTESLNAEIDRKAEETRRAYEEIERLRASDAASSARLGSLERRLRDVERQKAQANLRKTDPDALIKQWNQTIACYAEHFNDKEGQCIQGQWVPFGAAAPNVATATTTQGQ